ncbi:unnamed protein product [Arabidopsis lyrata]|uniref:F-box protein At1g30790 n=1 Tax=Arabidopsis lyrata subsp. lyrata TaxID=81972 RepID=UPI000A29DEA0|nr:F-box protein At1g30790 [Arabidopsis lyrata subsp. lyrata]CAH8253983.1 unnamed protein product [Arabidopsis lyrata]|eukprot:XP_020869751.1 F-box protein At1g30790 [Arabidopsis lyrata subsp. lyrata]
MKRRDDKKGRLCSISIPSKLDPIPFVLKMVLATAKFLNKTPQKKHLCREERDINKYDEKDTSPSKVDSIPLDLEVEILTRLPAKSLIKFQCVSKTWSSIIRSQRFIDSYYALSSTMRSDRFIIAFSNGESAKREDKRLFIFSSSYEGHESSSSLVTNLDMTIPSVTVICFSTCASVHGLIGSTRSGPFLVCNPCTGKVTMLPCSGAHTSFGYDPVDGQFKALTQVSPYSYQEPDFLVHEVLTLGGGESSWIVKKVTTPVYYTATRKLCINGFVYFGAWTPRSRIDPVIVCFDVRYERLSFIKAPMDVVCLEGDSILIEYKGKFASIVRHPYADFHSFDLWILEDVKTHDWSKQTFQLPFSLGLGTKMTSPGINKAGEIIFAPKTLSRDVQPFYIFYYNVERKDMRKVMLKGIADDEQFRRRYGLAGNCYVHISPEHVESIASL